MSLWDLPEKKSSHRKLIVGAVDVGCIYLLAALWLR